MEAQNKYQEQITEFIKESEWLHSESETQRELANIDTTIEYLCIHCLKCILGGSFEMNDNKQSNSDMFVIDIADSIRVYMHSDNISINSDFSLKIPLAYTKKYKAIYRKLKEIYKNKDNE
jgi:hypothetical protein